jgi:hypothetical protein
MRHCSWNGFSEQVNRLRRGAACGLQGLEYRSHCRLWIRLLLVQSRLNLGN